MLLVSPLVLFLVGLLVARVAKARRVWRRHSLFAVRAGVVLIVLYTAFSLAVLFDAPSVRPFLDMMGGAQGTAFFVGSGVVETDLTWPIEDRRLVALVIVSFMLYPFWFGFGLQAGFWMFGRSPKQTGILGLLR